MRVFFACVGSSLQIFHRLAAELAALTPLESVSYSVSDRRYTERYLAQHGPLTENGELLREWELVARGRARRVMPEELAAWESRLGVPSLWPAIVSDRRTYHGRLVKVRQDYAPYLTLAEMQGIMVETLETCWALFERQKPDAVVGFTAAFFEVIPIFWVARALGIPYLNMRSTKIANYVRLTSDPLERTDPHLEAHLARLGQRPDPALPEVAKALDFIEKARGKRVTYEGGLVRQKRRGLAAEFLRYAAYAPALLARDVWDAVRRLPFDTHRYPANATWREQTVGRAWRILQGRRAIRPRLVQMADLEKSGQPYAFFPLHAEPEIATSVLARHYMNQIEAARNIAINLPMGMQLVIKEHPRTWGLRPPGYYRRLAEIPNVVFVDVDESTDRVVRGASVVVVLSGFIGFEAALAGVPVVVLGRSFVTYLPHSMVRKVDALDDLAATLCDLMQTYAYDEDALTALVAAIIADAVPANLWSELLGKAGREHGTAAEGADRSQQEQIQLMAHYLLARATDPRLAGFQVAP